MKALSHVVWKCKAGGRHSWLRSVMEASQGAERPGSDSAWPDGLSVWPGELRGNVQLSLTPPNASCPVGGPLRALVFIYSEAGPCYVAQAGPNSTYSYPGLGIAAGTVGLTVRCLIFVFIETDFPVAQAGLDFTMCLRLALNL